MRIPMDQREEARFEMAPMIDMVFLLLVFFMCASHMSVLQNVQMEIPTATKAVVPKERPERFVVNITEAGMVYAGNFEIGMSNDPASLDNLKNMVKEQKAGIPTLKVYLRADQKTDHVHVKRVMAVMADLGIDDFIFGAFIPD